MRRKALVVLGMHRSGTSALTRALNLAGSFLPAGVLPPVPGENDSGFWESAKLVEADRRAMAAAGVSWDSATRIDPSWFNSDEAAMAAATLAQVFHEEFAGHELFVIKDPRLCRLVPVVRTALDRCSIDAGFVLILRHPAAVAASLAARDTMPRGHGQRLWLRYMLDAERASRGSQRVIVGFDDLITDWRATLDRIGHTLGVQLNIGTGTSEEIGTFLKPPLVHHTGGNDAPLDGLTGAAWAELESLKIADGTRRAMDKLDRIARVLDDAEALLGALAPHSMVRSDGREMRSNSGAPSPLAPPPSRVSLKPLHRLLTAARSLLRRRAESRPPHPLFEPSHYAQAAGIEHLPRDRWFPHFIEVGESHGISPHPLVDLCRLARGYGMKNPACGLLARFTRDARPPCNPHPLFDVEYYLERYPDVAVAGINPLVHYLLHGGSERRQPSPWFDERHYRTALGHTLPAGTTALQHYVQSGAARGVSPTPRFDPGFFATCHPAPGSATSDPLSACLDLHDGRIPDEFAAWDAAPEIPVAAPVRDTPDPALGYWLRRRQARDLFRLPGFWTGRVARVGFVVSQEDRAAAIGFARSLRRRVACRTPFLDAVSAGDCSTYGLDVMIVSDSFDPGRLRNRASCLAVICWSDIANEGDARRIEIVLNNDRLRFAIRAPGSDRFADELRRALVRLGHATRIDPADDTDDAVIVPPGVCHEPHPEQIILTWDYACDADAEAAARSLAAAALEQERVRMNAFPGEP